VPCSPLKLTDIPEVLIASIIRGSPWWWRQYAPLKHWSTSMWLQGATTQKTLAELPLFLSLFNNSVSYCYSLH
jgi:hypothetical protein